MFLSLFSFFFFAKKSNFFNIFSAGIKKKSGLELKKSGLELKKKWAGIKKKVGWN